MTHFKLQEDDAVRLQVSFRFPKRLFRIYEIVDPHVCIIGELGVRIEQPEENEIVLLRATLEKGSGVCDMRRDSRRIIWVLGMFLPSDLEDPRVDLHRLYRGAVMPQSGGDVITAAGADNPHRWGAR